MRYLFLIIALVFCCSCSCSRKQEKTKIGIDASWSPLNFGGANSYVNGFLDELLLEVAHEMHIEFEKIPASSDNLFLGLKRDQYAAILTSLPPYTFNVAKYDFSQNFLRIGPVLIIQENAKYKNLSQFDGMTLGMIAGDNMSDILQKYPEIRTRSYISNGDLLNAVVTGEVQGALMDRILAVNYVTDLYNGKLKIATLPLNNEGLHMIAEKGKHEDLVRSFDEAITTLKKKKYYRELLQKWKL